MTQTWGISGPAFLALYAVLLLFGLLLGLAIPRWSRRTAAVGPPPEVDAHRLAYLAGGARRLTDTVTAGLIADGVWRVSRGGRLHATGATPTHRLHLAAVEVSTGSGRERRRLSPVALMGTGAARELLTDLRDRGLVVPSGRHALRLLAMVPLDLALVLGVLRLVTGVNAGRPVGFLIGLVVVNLALVALVLLRALRAPDRTPLGEAVVAEARGRFPGGTPTTSARSRSGSAAGPAALTSVALLGFAGHPDPEVRDALHTASTSSGGGGGSSHSCGGGGDSGGGGGGGCGG
ncbi:hypothetical protein C1701_03630 [Actinoalloteichus sp. AHMU CJ021]|uniref:TIGR04222 domain-containing membrane protein n=1 Tax=Actinoalloteichus sp. AHMU CJ021 TaxID=2072503 RepID=UPI000CA07D4E|nr:hypothetical protein C1701_03630 [Actinoalloteichus sp. AHMU CJ021]